MKAILIKQFGNPEVLTLSDIAVPKPNNDQLLMRVHATALNRADLLQRRGLYPPPAGESEILGLEIAGEIVAIGSNVKNWQIGQRVFGLVSGGGYAEYCVIDAEMAMSIPENLSYSQAAAVAEAFITANETLFTLGELKSGESVLIHAAGSGVGTAAVQLAREAGATIFATAGSNEKLSQIKTLGAKHCINYKTENFAEIIGVQGIDVIEDFIGAKYFSQNLSCLKDGGRLIVIGLMGGNKTEIDLGDILKRRLQIKGSILRTRSLEDKRAITKRFADRWMPALIAGKIQPVIHCSFPLAEATAAHELMESNKNFGKIVLEITKQI